jgi:hypothetical protein
MSIEETIKELEALKQYIEKRIAELKEAKGLEKQGPVMPFKEIKPERPVPVDARPIIWLKTRIEQVKKKHPEAKIELFESKGLLERIEIHVGEKEFEEVTKDVETLAKWAFSTVLKAQEIGRENTSAFIRQG